MAAKTAAKAKAPKKPAAAKRQAKRTPDKGPQRYRADTYHEIEKDGGVLRVDVGDIVVTEGKSVTVYPPERFAESFPGVAV